jgi:hypothetical protein
MRVNARIHESEKDLLVVVVALLLFKKSCSSNLSKRVRIILCVLYKRSYVYVCVSVLVGSKLVRKSVRSVLLLRFRGFARGETCTRRNDDKQTPRHLYIYIFVTIITSLSSSSSREIHPTISNPRRRRRTASPPSRGRRPPRETVSKSPYIYPRRPFRLNLSEVHSRRSF